MSQIRFCNVVERTFEVWKRRFPTLFFGLHLKMEMTMAIIQSFFVLHNKAQLKNDPQPPDEIKNITQLLANEVLEVETVTQPQNNGPAQTFKTCFYNRTFFCFVINVYYYLIMMYNM